MKASPFGAFVPMIPPSGINCTRVFNDTFGKFELESAAALVVLTCAAEGDCWAPVTLDAIRSMIRLREINKQVTPSFDLNGFKLLVEYGWATWKVDKIELTQGCITRLINRWG